jgi:hypothetical protein
MSFKKLSKPSIPSLASEKEELLEAESLTVVGLVLGE